MAKYAVLNKDWALRGWTTLEKAAVNTVSGRVVPLVNRADYVLRSCDGKTDFEMPIFLDTHLEILNILEKQKIVTIMDTESSIQPYQKFRKAECPYVMNVHWAITGRCNLKCMHCFMESPSIRSDNPTFKQIETTVKSFIEANVPAVSLTGGEPLIRKDLFDIIALLNSEHIAVRQIYTNGILITEEILKKFEALPFKVQFNVSFDGVGWHDRMRGLKGTEEKTLRAIRMIKEAGHELCVATTIDRLSVVSLFETYETMKQYGVGVWRIMTAEDSGNWHEHRDLSLTLDEELKAYSPLFKRWHEDGHPMVVQFGYLFDGRKEGFEEFKPPVTIKHDAKSKACSTCAYSTYLGPEGKLLPCHIYTGTELEKQLPSIYEVGFAGAYNNELLRSINDMTIGDLFGENPECEGCAHLERCGIGCRAKAYSDYGKVTAKDGQMCAVMLNKYTERMQEI
ncbi:MAG: radical SAM protein [Deferribacterales bacterium]